MADGRRVCYNLGMKIFALIAAAAIAAVGQFDSLAAIVERAETAGQSDRLARFAAEGQRALADRLLMYWNSHATDVFVRNESVERVGGVHGEIQ